MNLEIHAERRQELGRQIAALLRFLPLLLRCLDVVRGSLGELLRVEREGHQQRRLLSHARAPAGRLRRLNEVAVLRTGHELRVYEAVGVLAAGDDDALVVHDDLHVVLLNVVGGLASYVYDLLILQLLALLLVGGPVGPLAPVLRVRERGEDGVGRSLREESERESVVENLARYAAVEDFLFVFVGSSVKAVKPLSKFQEAPKLTRNCSTASTGKRRTSGASPWGSCCTTSSGFPARGRAELVPVWSKSKKISRRNCKFVGAKKGLGEGRGVRRNNKRVKVYEGPCDN